MSKGIRTAFRVTVNPIYIGLLFYNNRKLIDVPIQSAKGHKEVARMTSPCYPTRFSSYFLV